MILMLSLASRQAPRSVGHHRISLGRPLPRGRYMPCTCGLGRRFQRDDLCPGRRCGDDRASTASGRPTPWSLAERPRGSSRHGRPSVRESRLDQSTITADLKPLADDERLVDFRDGEVHECWPGPPIMSGRRMGPTAGSRPLLTPAAAFESIDLLLLRRRYGSANRPWRRSGRRRGCHHARPTSVPGRMAVAQTRLPGAAGAFWWLLEHPPVGPRSLIEMEAYAPTYGWEHGCPPAIRRRAVGIAAVGRPSELLGVSLWRSRFAAFMFIACTAMGTAAVLVWNHRLSPLLAAGGALVKWDGSLAQRDVWVYRSTLREADVAVPWAIREGLGRHGW